MNDTKVVRAVLAIVFALLASDTSPPALASLAPLVLSGRDPAVAHSLPALVAPIAKPEPWTFAVLSDLHLPSDSAKTVHETIAALVAMRPRFVVVTGDFTNGSERYFRPREFASWWPTVRTALSPLRDAGIPVLPIAGNHDTYFTFQRDAYARAFDDLATWAAPLELHSTGTSRSSRAPFSYSVDVDGVHLALANVVSQHLDRNVASWLAADLEAARDAKFRIVFGHVPLRSVIREPKESFAAALGAILERGRASHYVAGHEHIVWDEMVALPAGASLRQVIVGCTSGWYSYQPTRESKMQAHCTRVNGARDQMRCTMPMGGEFEIRRGRKGRQVQHYKNSFTLFTVGDSVEVKPMTIVDGKPRSFYLDDH